MIIIYYKNIQKCERPNPYLPRLTFVKTIQKLAKKGRKNDFLNKLTNESHHLWIFVIVEAGESRPYN